MAHFLNLFSPETYDAFSKSDRSISGFRISRKRAADYISVGDKFVCYMTKLSRWVGVLEVESDWFQDNSPIFEPENDPFIVRFKVRPLVWLEPEKAIPIHQDEVWRALSFTRNHDKSTSTWTGRLRSSLGRLSDKDGAYLEQRLMKQSTEGVIYELDEQDQRKLTTHQVRRPEGIVSVSVPDDAETIAKPLDVIPDEARASTKNQALVAQIGAQMGFKIWIPKADRGAVFKEWRKEDRPVLDMLPLNYDETTLRTIEQIDVLWLKGRSIVRAFEVEHTTSIYSGILRMADLLALQPNMDIKLHIVAPIERREKVFQELRRPVFSLLERGPLSESCTYLSYDSVRDLSREKHLTHLSDSVLEEYAEEAE